MSDLKINVGKWNNIRQKFGMWFFFVPFFLIIGFMMYFVLSSKPSTEGMVEIEATVTQIVEVSPATDEDPASYNTVIEYEYNDHSYLYVLESYSQDRTEGTVIKVYINPLNPGEGVVDLDSYNSFFWIIIGFAAFGFLIIFLTSPKFRKRAKNANIHLDDDDVDAYGSDKEELDDKYYRNEDYISEGSSASNGELIKTLYFTYDKRIPQGHIFEDEGKNPVYEIKSKNFHMLLPITYSFNNLKNGKENLHKITNKTTISSSSGNTHAIESVRYTIDGVDIWEFLKSIDVVYKVDALTVFKPVYSIYKKGELIAKATTTGTNLHEEESKNFLSNLPAPGFYKVELNPAYMETIAIVMMLITRCSQA